MLARGVIGWIHLFGAVNSELFGRLNTLVEARETYFAIRCVRSPGSSGCDDRVRSGQAGRMGPGPVGLQSRPWRSQPQCSQPLPQDEPA